MTNRASGFPHYGMCSACAKEMGGRWPKDHVATMTYMECPYCKGKKQLPNEPVAPWLDYDWPDRKKTAAARAGRD